MKRVLLITYEFPPRGGTGVFRVMKFARYLPEWGWQPVVVTVAGAGPHPDPGLLAELPADLEILRVAAPALPSSPTPVDTGAFTSQPPPRPPTRCNAFSVPDTLFIRWAGPTTRPDSWRKRLKPWIVPDPQLLWVPGAVRAATSRITKGDIAAMITSGPPFSTNLAGWWLKRRFPVMPWLMDMRDLWSEGLGQRHLVPYKLNRMLEQRSLQAADHTTVVSDGIRDLTIRRLDVDPACISTLTNGFDPNDFLGVGSREPGVRDQGMGNGEWGMANGEWETENVGQLYRLPAPGSRLPAPGSRLPTPNPLRVCYVGTLPDLRAGSAEGLFLALRGLADEGVDRSQLEVQFIGTFAPRIHAWAAPLIAAGLVEILPFVPHVLALERMASADVLLLILSDDWEGRIAHTNKFFEYLALGRPILAVAPEGEVTRLLEAEGAGLYAAPDDVDAIAAALRRLIAEHAAGQLQSTSPQPDRFRRFHRRELAGQLARLLDQITQASNASSHSAKARSPVL